jgi:membrane protease subunit (stomatin/prohibitin family)
MRVVDPKKFIKEFAGTNPWVTIEAVSEQLRNTIISKLSEGLAEAGVSVLDLAANFTEIGNRLKPIFQTDFDVWGIELGQFYIENVSLPEEVEKMLDKSTSVNMLSDKLNQFNQMQAGIAMEKMADNPGAAGTAGLGAGVILTNMMQQAQQPQPQNAGTATSNDQQKMLDLLKQLGDLKTAGVLTEEEFNKKKAEILSKL